MKEFWSIENAAGHEADIKDLEKIGQQDAGNRRYILYQDQEGRGWYKTIIKKDGEWMTEEHAAIGQKRKAGRASPRH